MKFYPLFKKALRLLKPYRWFVSLQFVIGVILAIDLSLRPYLIKLILDDIPSVPPAVAAENISFLVAIYLALSIFTLLLYRFDDWMRLRSEPNIMRHATMTLMHQMMQHSHNYYLQNFSGNLTNKIDDVASEVPRLLRKITHTFFGRTLAIGIATYTVSQVDHMIAVGLLIWVVIFLAVGVWMVEPARKLSDQAAEAHSGVMGQLVDTLANMMTVRLFIGQPTETAHINKELTKSVKAWQARDWFFVRVYLFQGLSFVTFQAVCFWLLIRGLRMGTVTAGDFALILTVNLALVDCLYQIAGDIYDFADAFGRISQGLRAVYQPLEIVDKPYAAPLVVTQGRIEFQHVKFHYKSSTPLFEDLSVVLHPGQKVGLVGYSGSGKTTFVNLILRLFDINEGKILIDGQDISEVTQESLRQAIAVIPQEPSLFNRSLLENLRYGRPIATNAEIVEATSQAHAHEFIQRLGEGYETSAGERGVKLSGGQRQRIAISRAILKNAPILILDEATSQLDSITEGLIQTSMSQLMQGKTVIVIAHRLSTLLNMDRIIVFDKGRIVEDGTHAQLIHANGLYATMWATQANGFLPSRGETVASVG